MSAPVSPEGPQVRQGALAFEGEVSAERASWHLGGRWGNQWTEIVLGDYEDVVLVRTHLPVPSGRPHESAYEPVPDWLGKVERYARALNDGDATPPTATDPCPTTDQEESR